MGRASTRRPCRMSGRDNPQTTAPRATNDRAVRAPSRLQQSIHTDRPNDRPIPPHVRAGCVTAHSTIILHQRHRDVNAALEGAVSWHALVRDMVSSWVRLFTHPSDHRRVSLLNILQTDDVQSQQRKNVMLYTSVSARGAPVCKKCTLCYSLDF